MLTIRKEQMDALASAFMVLFQKQLLTQLREQHPEKFTQLGEEGCQRLMQDGVAKAKSYSITCEHDVAAFIDLMFGYGPEFETSAQLGWTRDVLSDKELVGTTKMALILSRLQPSPE